VDHHANVALPHACHDVERCVHHFREEAAELAEGPVLQRIALQDGVWDVAAMPRGGWISGVQRAVWFFRLAGLAFAGLLAFVLYLIGQRVSARQQHARDLARNEVDVWRKALRVIGHEINNSLAPVTSLLHSAKLMTSQPTMLPRLTSVLDMIEERAQLHLCRETAVAHGGTFPVTPRSGGGISASIRLPL